MKSFNTSILNKLTVLITVFFFSGCSNFLTEATYLSSLDEVEEDSSIAELTISGDIESEAVTSESELEFSLTWSEEVSGFTEDDIEIANATLSSLTGSGTDYVLTVENGSDSDVTITVCADAVEEGNDETTFSYTFEADALTLTITSDLGNSVNSETIPLTIAFSHSVSDFTVDTLSSTGGSFSNFDGSDTDYTVDLNVSDDGTYIVSLSEGVVSSAIYTDVDNESASLEIEYDGTSPTVEISSSVAEADTTGLDELIFTIAFSEEVTGFELDDITSENGTLSGFSGTDDNYEVTLTPSDDGEVTFSIEADVCEDSFGNPNEEGEFSFSYDSSLVGVTISSVEGTVTAESTIDMLIEFDEDVTGLDEDDFTVTNGTVQNLEGSGTDYTMELVPSDEGEVILSLDQGTVFNDSDNGNSYAELSLTYDSVAPETPEFTLTMNSSGTELESGSYSSEIVLLTLDTDYSEDSGSELSYEYTIDGENFADFNDSAYLADETTYEEINIRVSDEAGNSTLGTAVTSITVDQTSPDNPSVSIITDPVDADNYTAFSFTISGGEEDCTYNYTISDESYNELTGYGTFTSSDDLTLEDIDLSELEDGEITVQVSQSDLAGNTSGTGSDDTDKDTVVPTTPSVTIYDDSVYITSSNNDSFSFEVEDGEAGLTYNYTISTDGGDTSISDSGEFGDDGAFTVEDLDISSLSDGTLTVSVYQTDDVGNVSYTGTATATLNGTVENDTDVSVDVDADNEGSYTFTIYGEAGASYTYTIISSGGGDSITGSGDFGDEDEVTVTVDLSGLEDGYLVFTVTVTDDDNNSTTVSVVEKSSIEASTDTADFSDATDSVSFDLTDHTSQTVPSSTEGETEVVKYDTYELIGSDYDDTIKFSALEDGEEFTIDGGDGENTIDLTSYPSYDISLTAGEYDGESQEDAGTITVTVDSDSGETAVIYYQNFQILDFSTYNFTGSPHTLELDTSDSTVWEFSDTSFTLYNPNSTNRIALIEFAGSLDENYSLDTSLLSIEDDTATYKNGFIIFDYQDEDNYKFVRAHVKADKWQIGEYIDGSLTNNSYLSEDISDTEYNSLELIVTGDEGMTAELWSDGEMKLSYDFDDALNDGRFGLTNQLAYSDFTIDMTPSNWAPYVMSYDETISQTEGEDMTLDLLSDAYDYEGDSLSLESVDTAGTLGGTITNNEDGTVTYSMPSGYTYGTDTFYYTISDGTNTTEGTIEFDVIY
ncbi:MAG: Ig-like domain-containing protein [Spirochaetales bacterium]|nr:Ig-like domain-containing protein [Spirochaetales bacterium]